MPNYDPSEHEPLPEGKEAPPPLTHTMAIVRWVILIAISIFALGMILSYLGLAPWEAKAETSVQYHCPMHPTYVSNQPGDCPICGMSLVPIDKSGKEIALAKTTKKTDIKTDSKTSQASAKATPSMYGCTMCPDVKSTKPGNCPNCGMKLVPIKTEKVSKLNDAKVEQAKYVCPMDPEVISDKPGSCPKCGMDLVKAENPVKADSAVADTSSSPSVQASKYVCPMDPEITSDKPGRCSKCGMFLKAVAVDSSKSTPAPKSDSPDKRGEINNQSMPGMDMSSPTQSNNESPGNLGEAPVPGLVPVTIEPERLQLIGVKTAEVTERNLGGEISVVGTVTPDESRIKNMNVRVNGWVQNLYVDKTGQYVEAGKPLLSIYSQELYQAEQDFFVARDALKEGGSDPALSEMRNQIFSSAKERLRLLGLTGDQIDEIAKADAPSEELTLTSPFSGYVLEKNVLPGQYLGPDQNLFTIADLSQVWVLGDVYEQDISSVHIGQKALMHLTAYPGEVFEGKIGYIYPSVSDQTHTMKVRIEFANPSNRIRPGMYADINLERGGGQMLSVPNDAILDGGTEKYAFVVHDGNHFEPRLVTTGHMSDDYTEVLSGLHEGETVVSSANFLIDSESRLKAAVSGMSSMPDMPGMSDTPKTDQEALR